ncbi:hypothetical protein ABK040_011317 [Willaertia magna]
MRVSFAVSFLVLVVLAFTTTMLHGLSLITNNNNKPSVFENNNQKEIGSFVNANNVPTQERPEFLLEFASMNEVKPLQRMEVNVEKKSNKKANKKVKQPFYENRYTETMLLESTDYARKVDDLTNKNLIFDSSAAVDAVEEQVHLDLKVRTYSKKEHVVEFPFILA